MAEVVFHTLKQLEKDLQLAQVRYASERETSHVLNQKLEAADRELSAIRETEISLKERLLALEAEHAQLRSQSQDTQANLKANQSDLEILRANADGEIAEIEAQQKKFMDRMVGYFASYSQAVKLWSEREDVRKMHATVRSLCQEAGTVDVIELESLQDERLALQLKREEAERMLALTKRRLASEVSFVQEQRNFVEKSANEVKILEGWLDTWSKVADTKLCPRCIQEVEGGGGTHADADSSTEQVGSKELVTEKQVAKGTAPPDNQLRLDSGDAPSDADDADIAVAPLTAGSERGSEVPVVEAGGAMGEE